MIEWFRQVRQARKERTLMAAFFAMSLMDEDTCVLCSEPNEECGCGLAHDCGPDCD